MLLVSFSCLIALARTSSTMLNRSGKSGHLCLVPVFRGNVFSLSLLNIYDVCFFFICDFYYVEVFPSIPSLLCFFFFLIVKGC